MSIGHPTEGNRRGFTYCHFPRWFTRRLLLVQYCEEQQAGSHMRIIALVVNLASAEAGRFGQ